MTTFTSGTHEVKVKWQHAWDEWLARCSCGWVGDYLSRELSAWDNARDHLRDHERSDSQP